MPLVKQFCAAIAAGGVIVWPAATAQMIDQLAARDAAGALDACIASGSTELQCKRDFPATISPGLEPAEDVRFEAISVFGIRGLDRAGSSSIISASDIADRAADHPAEILNTVPGVNIHMNSLQEHLIAIRSPVLTGGAGQGSFLVLENGVPTRSPAFGNVNILIEPHHETAEFIEIVRGPGSAQYGSNAIHGLINIIHGGPHDRSIAAHLSGSTLGRQKIDLIADQGYLGRGALSVQSDTGWRDNTDLLQLKASGQVETTLGDWKITGWGSSSFMEQETADFLNGAKAYKDRDIAKANDDPLAYRDAWSVRLGARLARDVFGGELSFTPFARHQNMDFRQHFLPNKSFEENGHTGAGVMVRYSHTPSDNIDWRLGLDTDIASGFLKERQDEPFGFFPGDGRFPVGLHYDYDVDTALLGVWGEIDWQLDDKTELQVGIRAETHNYDYRTNIPAGINGRFKVPENRDDDFDFVTPKLAILHELAPNTTLYARYARASRAPQASDLYRIQSLQGTAEASVETADSFEVGVRGLGLDGALVYEITAYHMEKDNFFFRDADGINVTDGSTRHKGIEAGADLVLNDHWRLRGAVSWSDQTYTFDRIVGRVSDTISEGDRIDTAPEWLGDAAIVWTPDNAFEAVLSAEHIGEYFTNPGNTRSYPGHTIVSLRSSYQYSPELSAYIHIQNLFDTAYADRADFGFGSDRFFPGEPLNATIGIRRTF